MILVLVFLVLMYFCCELCCIFRLSPLLFILLKNVICDFKIEFYLKLFYDIWLGWITGIFTVFLFIVSLKSTGMELWASILLCFKFYSASHVYFRITIEDGFLQHIRACTHHILVYLYWVLILTKTKGSQYKILSKTTYNL